MKSLILSALIFNFINAVIIPDPINLKDPLPQLMKHFENSKKAYDALALIDAGNLTYGEAMQSLSNNEEAQWVLKNNVELGIHSTDLIVNKPYIILKRCAERKAKLNPSN